MTDDYEDQIAKRRAWVDDSDLEALMLERTSGMYKDGDTETPVEQANRLIRDNAPMAAMTLVRLAMHSENDTVRLRSATEILNRAQQVGGGADGREPWAGVFEATVRDAEQFANE
jgi:hypothetical protein